MKDRYLCGVLLVGQACWEASPGKDDDVADHPSESHNIVFRSSQPGWPDANGARLKEQATPGSWSVPRIGWEVKVPHTLAERKRFAR